MLPGSPQIRRAGALNVPLDRFPRDSGVKMAVSHDFCIASPGIHLLQSNGQNASAFIREWLLTTEQETRVALTCASCGNDQNFLVKTLQMHVVHLDDSRVEVSEEGRPAVLEVLCDECENPLQLEDMDAGIRKELLLTLGAR